MVIGPPSSAILRYARVVVDVGRHPSGLGAGGRHWYSDATALLTVYQIRDIERLASEQPEVTVEVLSILGDRPDTRTEEEQRVAAEFHANNLDLVREVNAELGYPDYPPIPVGEPEPEELGPGR